MSLLQKNDVFVILTPERVVIDSYNSLNRLNVAASYAAVAKTDDCEVGDSLWVVIKTEMSGGGTGHGPHDVYPDGWGVTAAEITEDGSPTGRRIFFRQSGCFTNELLPDAVKIVGRKAPVAKYEIILD